MAKKEKGKARDISFIRDDLEKARAKYYKKIRKPLFAKNGYDRHMNLAAEQGFSEGWVKGALYMYDRAQASMSEIYAAPIEKVTVDFRVYQDHIQRIINGRWVNFRKATPEEIAISRANGSYIYTLR